MMRHLLLSAFLLAAAVGFAAEPAAATDHLRLAALVEKSGGNIRIPAGHYRFGGTLEIDLKRLSAVTLSAAGPVTITMAAAGPAIRVVGSLTGRAHPETITPETWRERMPTITGIEILGAHPEADGIELLQTLQPIISRVAIRDTRHGIVLAKRNRNVIISDVHIYHCTDIGLYLDHVDLHQINVSNSHISYCRKGGIVIRGGNVRNVQITGCDIEANMPNDPTPTTAANILIEQTKPGESIAEVAITGCTIQHFAHYHPQKQAPGGANIRVLGSAENPFKPNMINITGNVMSDTHCHVHLRHATDVTLTGNNFFTTEPTDLLVENCARVTVAACVFNPRESKGTGEIVFRDSSHCVLSGLTTLNLQAGEAAIRLENCRAMRVTGCIIAGSKNGIALRGGAGCAITDCTVTDLPAGGVAVIGTLGDHLVRDVLADSTIRKE